MARIPRVISASQSMLLRFGDPLDERQNSAENGLRWFVWYRKTNRVGKGDFSYSKQIIIYNIIIFLSTELRRWVGRRKEILKLTFQALTKRNSLWRGANVGSASFRNPLRWPIYNINLVDKTKLFRNTLNQRSTTVSLETYSL